MKGVVTVLQAILIFAVAMSLALLAVPVVISSVGESMDISESSSVKQQLEQCNNKIVETVRTGTQSTCTFSLQGSGRSEISVKNDGIYYELLSEANICDQTNWTEINPEKHVWLKCGLQDSKRLYQLKWSSPDEIIFTLGNRTTGNVLEINRLNITADEVNLFIEFR